jgi:hypothetical protein
MENRSFPSSQPEHGLFFQNRVKPSRYALLVKIVRSPEPIHDSSIDFNFFWFRLQGAFWGFSVANHRIVNIVRTGLHGAGPCGTTGTKSQKAHNAKLRLWAGSPRDVVAMRGVDGRKSLRVFRGSMLKQGLLWPFYLAFRRFLGISRLGRRFSGPFQGDFSAASHHTL